MIKGNKNWLRILLWLASVGAMIGLMILGSRVLEEDNAGLLLEFAVITVVTLAFLYLISGKKTFTFLHNQTGYTVKTLFPTLLFPILFAFFGAISAIMERPPLIDQWPKKVLLSAANMFLVGVYEEGCFRACACDALLPALKNRTHPFLITAIVSGLVFGYVHVVSRPPADPAVHPEDRQYGPEWGHVHDPLLEDQKPAGPGHRARSERFHTVVSI